MIVVMQPDASEEVIKKVEERIKSWGFDIHRSSGESRTILGLIGRPGEDIMMVLQVIPGVENVVRISKPYKLACREFRPENTVIDLGGGIKIGGEKVVVMAGPCAVEGEKEILEAAWKVKECGAAILRAGAYKPRTSPYSFQGFEKEGLRFLKKAQQETGLPIVTEVVDPSSVDEVAEYADILQVGTRNMQNFYLLKELGRISRPVLLKRGMSATIEEWLMAAEYIMNGGNFQVILCERGIRTFETYTRNTLDLSAIPVIKELSHLPVIVDPSHATGRWTLVSSMSKAAVAAGADGLLVEVHPCPQEALSDGPQSLNPENFREMMDELKGVAQSVGRSL